jgi:hypothetical protein
LCGREEFVEVVDGNWRKSDFSIQNRDIVNVFVVEHEEGLFGKSVKITQVFFKKLLKTSTNFGVQILFS